MTWDPGFDRAAADTQLSALIQSIHALADQLHPVAPDPAPVTPPTRPSPEPAPPYAPPNGDTGVCMGAWPSDTPH